MATYSSRKLILSLTKLSYKILGVQSFGQSLSLGENHVDQLVEIIKVLGTPTREEIRCMNPNYNDFRFPQIKAHPWHKIPHEKMPPEVEISPDDTTVIPFSSSTTGLPKGVVLAHKSLNNKCGSNS